VLFRSGGTGPLTPTLSPEGERKSKIYTAPSSCSFLMSLPP